MTMRRSLCLRIITLMAVFVCSLTIDAAPLCARGNVHIIIVVSTTDPVIREANLLWKEKIEGALSGEEGTRSVESREGVLYRSAEQLGGLGKDDVATYRVLEGNDAHPDNIAKVCREVSMEAGADDAVAVFMVGHGYIAKDANGDYRHRLLHIAQDGANSSIERGEIMRALKSREHRLVVLLTDACSALPTNLAVMPSVQTGVYVPSFFPKRDCYLKRFLTEAEGEVNINSTDYGEKALFLVDKVDRRVLDGTRFSDAFVKFAWNGEYLEDELTPDGFYKLLSLELTYELNRFNATWHENCKQTLTSFKDDNLRDKRDVLSISDYFAINADRFRTMEDSGEFPENDDKSPIHITGVTLRTVPRQ